MDKTLSVIEYQKAVAEIQEGIDSFKNNEGKPADEAFAALAEKLNIPIEVERNDE